MNMKFLNIFIILSILNVKMPVNTVFGYPNEIRCLKSVENPVDKPKKTIAKIISISEKPTENRV